MEIDDNILKEELVKRLVNEYRYSISQMLGDEVRKLVIAELQASLKQEVREALKDAVKADFIPVKGSTEKVNLEKYIMMWLQNDVTTGADSPYRRPRIATIIDDLMRTDIRFKMEKASEEIIRTTHDAIEKAIYEKLGDSLGLKK